MLKRLYPSADSATFSLVSDSAICKAVLKAYNAQSKPADHLDSAFVLYLHHGYMIYLTSGDIPGFKGFGTVELNDSLRVTGRGLDPN